MAVSVIWSSTNGGSSIAAPLSHGTTLMQGSESTAQTIYVRHNGSNSITGCGLYLQAYTDTYTGDTTAATDKSELVAWGDGASSSLYGGIKVNMNATGSFPTASWSTFSNKSSADGYGFTIRTGVGDSTSNPLTILTVTGATASGTIQTGASPNVRFQMKIAVPSAEDTSGTRLFALTLKYTFTS